MYLFITLHTMAVAIIDVSRPQPQSHVSNVHVRPRTVQRDQLAFVVQQTHACFVNGNKKAVLVDSQAQARVLI